MPRGVPLASMRRTELSPDETRNAGLWPALTISISDRRRVEPQEDGGDIAAAGLGAFVPVLLGQAPGELAQGKGLAGEGAKGGAEGGADESGREPLSGDVGDDHEVGAVGLGYDVEVVSADLVAGSGTRRYGVAGDGRHGLGQEALLDGAGGVEILGEAGVVQVALVVDGVFDGNGGLEDKTLEEVAFIKAERPSLRGGDDEF